MSRTIVVTGGSSGIGSKIVEKFTSDGDDVIIVDRNEPAVGGTFVRCDLSSVDSIDEAEKCLPDTIDVLVNAAGVSGLAPIPVVLKVNFYGLRYFTERVSSRIAAGGSVVNVASTSSWYWRDHLADIAQILKARTEDEVIRVCDDLIADGHTAYTRSKEAVVLWSAVAAQEYLGRFRVNSVSPGPVETPLLADFYKAMGHEELDPLTARAGGRNGRPEEIANVVAFLAAADAHWVNGTDIPTDNSAEIAEFLASNNIIEPLGK